MKANIRYNTVSGKLLEGNFGEVGECGENEAIIQLEYIPDFKTHTIVDGKLTDFPPEPLPYVPTLSERVTVLEVDVAILKGT